MPDLIGLGHIGLYRFLVSVSVLGQYQCFLIVSKWVKYAGYTGTNSVVCALLTINTINTIIMYMGVCDCNMALHDSGLTIPSM